MIMKLCVDVNFSAERRCEEDFSATQFLQENFIVFVGPQFEF